MRILTGMDRSGQEWTSITGTDLKIHPKIYVLSVFDKKKWLRKLKYQKSSVSRQFQCKKCFCTSKHDILVPYGLFMWGDPDGYHRTALISWHMLDYFCKDQGKSCEHWHGDYNVTSCHWIRLISGPLFL